MADLIGLITATDPAVRNLSMDEVCAGLSTTALLEQCEQLENFRRRSANLYERVRALFFLYAIHRFHLPRRLAEGAPAPGKNKPPLIPFTGYELLLRRRFEEAIDCFLSVQKMKGPSDSISS